MASLRDTFLGSPKVGESSLQRPIDSSAWTGASTVAVLEKPRHPAAPHKLRPSIDRNTMSEAAMVEYREVAETVGVSAQDILVEEFRLFLAKHDIPTFNLSEVVSYMDDLAAKDNTLGFGWHWCPVRERDAETPLRFGRPSVSDQSLMQKHWGSGATEKPSIASDYYESHNFFQRLAMVNAGHVQADNWRTMRSPAYTRTLPLHALKKIALIEREFTAGKPVFLVTDYATAPHIMVNPDPFLMAVIPNSAVGFGKGRFIIDVWDEPGFDIDRMVK
jgi:hypothetical protein